MLFLQYEMTILKDAETPAPHMDEGPSVEEAASAADVNSAWCVFTVVLTVRQNYGTILKQRYSIKNLMPQDIEYPESPEQYVPP